MFAKVWYQVLSNIGGFLVEQRLFVMIGMYRNVNRTIGCVP